MTILGDPCTISSQRELDEALRLLHVNGEAELNIHVFLGIPALPGLPCNGEDSKFFCFVRHVTVLCEWNSDCEIQVIREQMSLPSLFDYKGNLV